MFKAPLATARPPRGIPVANPTISGVTTPIALRSACQALIFDRSTCVTTFHNAFNGFGCCAAGSLPVAVLADAGDKSIREYSQAFSAKRKITWEKYHLERSTNLAHVA